MKSTHLYVDKPVAVVGFGVTGKACVDFFLTANAKVCLFVEDIYKVQLQITEFPILKQVQLREFNSDSDFSEFDLTVVSPGISTKHKAIEKALENELDVISEIELFARHNDVPVIGVTGSNGKSTVVDMIHQGMIAADVKAGIGGNFGVSAIKLLKKEYQIIVLELSSFQLELTYSLDLKIAVILNITPDHIDRHSDFDTYAKVKQRIYKHAQNIIVNRDDSRTRPSADEKIIASFGKSPSSGSRDSIQDEEGIRIGKDVVFPAYQLEKLSEHAKLNVQVALLCADITLEKDKLKAFSDALLNYKGLPHRFELVKSYVNKANKSVYCINDSKATNPGAAIAAINSIPENTYLILIVGGDSKGSELDELATLVQARVDCLICIGKDAHRFVNMAANSSVQDDFEGAVELAIQEASICQTDVYILLSPACSSLDMFENFQHRGESFSQVVKQRCVF